MVCSRPRGSKPKIPANRVISEDHTSDGVSWAAAVGAAAVADTSGRTAAERRTAAVGTVAFGTAAAGTVGTATAAERRPEDRGVDTDALALRAALGLEPELAAGAPRPCDADGADASAGAAAACPARPVATAPPIPRATARPPIRPIRAALVAAIGNPPA